MLAVPMTGQPEPCWRVVLSTVCTCSRARLRDTPVRHHARRAIALCAAGPHADSMTVAVMPTRGFGLKDSVF